VVAILYLNEEAPWTATLRELNSIGKIIYKDEFSRRIVLEFPKSKINSVKHALAKTANSSVFEVKLVCHSRENLLEKGQFKWRRVGKRAAYGIVLGNYIFAEIVGRSLIIKLGRASRTSNPPSILPASTFQFSVDEVESALDTARHIVELVSGGKGGNHEWSRLRG
jgi:hypothetical protein